MKFLSMFYVSILLCMIISKNIFASKKTVNLDFKQECTTAKEFITSYNFLKGHKEFKIKEREASKIASKITEGCNGSSLRFIKITNLLIKANLDAKSAIETALDFVKLEDIHAETFINVFKLSYVKKFMDLDIFTSRKLALSLSKEFSGDTQKANIDFKNLVNFCVSQEELALPKPTCAQIAAKITKLGAPFKGQISEPFIKLFRFLLSSKKGPKRPTYEAINISKKVIKYGPTAVENYIDGYRFATSKSGLKLSAKNAMKFSLNLAENSVKN